MYEGKYRVVRMWEMGLSDLDRGPGKAFLRKGCLECSSRGVSAGEVGRREH